MAPTTRSMCTPTKKGVRQSSAARPRRTSQRVATLSSTTTANTATPVTRKRTAKLNNNKQLLLSATGAEEDKTSVFEIDLLPEWVLVHIFSFLSVKEKCRLSRVSTRWKYLIQDPRLWKLVTDSPEDTGDLLKFIRAYLGKSLWCFRPNTMTTAGLRLLESQCPHLKYLLVEFNDKTLHHFVHLDIDYLPHSVDNVIIKATRTQRSTETTGSKKGLVFYLVAVRDFTKLKLPVDGFDELSLISRRQRNEDVGQDVNLGIFRIPNVS